MSRNQNDVRRSFARALVALALASLFPLMTGCAFVAQVTRVKGSVPITTAESAHLAIDIFWVQEREGSWVLHGYVQRKPDASRDASGHVDVVFRGPEGSVLQVNELALDRWRKQPRQRRTLAGFNLELPRVPDATAAIELVPHEGPLGPS
jgi:hypothetical protein